MRKPRYLRPHSVSPLTIRPFGSCSFKLRPSDQAMCCLMSVERSRLRWVCMKSILHAKNFRALSVFRVLSTQIEVVIIIVVIISLDSTCRPWFSLSSDDCWGKRSIQLLGSCCFLVYLALKRIGFYFMKSLWPKLFALIELWRRSLALFIVARLPL